MYEKTVIYKSYNMSCTNKRLTHCLPFILTSRAFPDGPLATLVSLTRREAQGTYLTPESLITDSVRGSTPLGPWLYNLS